MIPNITITKIVITLFNWNFKPNLEEPATSARYITFDISSSSFLGFSVMYLKMFNREKKKLLSDR